MGCCVSTGGGGGSGTNPRVAFEGPWGASEAIGRFAMAVFATPMALVMRMSGAA